MSVAGGLCTTVSTTGITTAGVPFNDCETWVVVADRNLEKPGDKHLVENILDERFQAKIRFHEVGLFFKMADNICVTLTQNAVQGNEKTADWCCKSSAIFEVLFDFCVQVRNANKLRLFCTRAEKNDT